MNRCPESLLESLMRLARIRLPREEACRYIGEIEAWAERLLSEAPESLEPLYYVWDEPSAPPSEPLEPDTVDTGILEPRDGEGNLLLPWRPGAPPPRGADKHREPAE